MAGKVPSDVSRYLSEIGRIGGKKKSATKGFGALTPEERAQNASRAAKAMWAKKRKAAKKKAKG